jgi:WXG100 family type VII secretion target
MPADRLRVEYNTLNNLSKAFLQEAQDTEQLVQRLTQAAEQLYSTGWSGRAADSFYKEAAEVMFPAMSKLGTILQDVGDLITACLKIYYESELEVAKLFHKETTGGSAKAKQGYDPNEGVKAFWSAFGNRWLKIGADEVKSKIMSGILGPTGMIISAPGLIKTLTNAYHENGGGGLGILGAVNVFNPVSHLMEAAYTADQELDKAFYLDQLGDHQAAMKHFTQGGEAFADTTKAAVDTAMTAVDGAKMISKHLGGDTPPSNKGEPPGDGSHGSNSNPANTLVGESTSQMRRDAARLIGESDNHPLKFLLDEDGNFKGPTRGVPHDELINFPDRVQMGHIISSKSGQPEKIMLQGAWDNQFNRITIEKPHSGVYAENVAVDIGGVAVDITTAKFWEKLGWLPEGTVSSAPQITFFSVP